VNLVTPNPIIYTVDYLDGFQYENGKLLFFPTAEGYVKYTESATNPFDYVFNYTDHLGNIRLSYAINPATGLLKKMEENNYYPFGLKHGSYNTEEIIIAPRPVGGPDTGKFMKQKGEPLAKLLELPTENPTLIPDFYSGYNFKYQGQERQDELGLNWDSFKWRNYDYAIGRFMGIDPLAEEYDTWTPYAFSGNRVIDSRELEGLEPYRLFKTEEEAALNWGEQYNDDSIRDSKEYGSMIGKSKVKGKVRYSYGPPVKSKSSNSVTPSPAPNGTIATADIHSHGSYDINILSWNDRFSDEDKAGNRKLGINGYLTTPNGTLQVFFPNGNGEFIINRDLANDPKDPTSPITPVTPVTQLTPSPIVPSHLPSPIPGGIPSHIPKPNPPTPKPNSPILPALLPNIPRL